MRSTVLLLLSGLALACAQSVPSLADPVATARPTPRDPYADHIAEAAQRFELPAAWIKAVLRAESNGDPRAVSPKGAIGLMQIMPQTWAGLRDRHRLGADPYDQHDNIIAGAAYIRELFDRYGSPGWIAAYNAGPGRYEASLSGRPLPSETRAYVAGRQRSDQTYRRGGSRSAGVDPCAAVHRTAGSPPRCRSCAGRALLDRCGTDADGARCFRHRAAIRRPVRRPR